MPIYEYECVSCHHTMEVLQKISDTPLSDCPACNTPELKKKVSAAGFRLKGSGWYETDFKTGNKKNLAGSASESSSSSKGESTGTSSSGDSSAKSTSAAAAN